MDMAASTSIYMVFLKSISIIIVQNYEKSSQTRCAHMLSNNKKARFSVLLSKKLSIYPFMYF